MIFKAPCSILHLPPFHIFLKEFGIFIPHSNHIGFLFNFHISSCSPNNFFFSSIPHIKYLNSSNTYPSYFESCIDWRSSSIFFSSRSSLSLFVVSHPWIYFLTFLRFEEKWKAIGTPSSWLKGTQAFFTSSLRLSSLSKIQKFWKDLLDFKSPHLVPWI